MRILLLSLLSLLSYNNLLLGCCAGETLSFSELVLSTEDPRSLLLIQVDSAWADKSGGFYSLATVKKSYKNGTSKKQILIRSGSRNSSAGGYYLIPKASYFLAGYSNDGYSYSGFVCDAFSHMIDPNKVNSRHPYLPAIEAYYEKTQEAYTGKVELEYDGNIFAEGNLKNGLPHGEWRHYNRTIRQDDLEPKRDKNIRSKENYLDGKLHGLVISSSSGKSGLTRNTKTYEYGKLMEDKIYRETEEGSYIKVLASIKNKGDFFLKESFSKKDAVTFFWERNELFFSLPTANGIRKRTVFHGLNKEYHQNGQLKESGEYWWGAKIGLWKSFNTHGKLIAENTYEKPLRREDIYMEFHPNGKTKALGQFEDGKPVGKWQFFSAGSILIMEYSMQNMKLNGEFKKFRHQTGNLYELKKYKNGLLDGPFKKLYNDEKTVIQEGSFKEGIKTGIWKKFHEDGTLKEEVNYHNNFMQGPMTVYHKNGNIKSQSFYQNGVYDKEFKRYTNNNKLIEFGRYRMGQKYGDWKSFHTSKRIWTIKDYGEPRDNFTFNNQHTNKIRFEDEDGNPVLLELTRN